MMVSLRNICILTLCTAVLGWCQAPTFQLQGYLVGQSMPVPAQTSEPMMGEIQKIGSGYFLYFTTQPPGGAGMIQYATSTDMVNWAIQDTIIFGVNDSTSREFILGGPRVIQTSLGQYRMFYRTCQKVLPGQDPHYHIRSALSSDGIHFTPEGVRIEINMYNPTSFFTHVGHSEFYYDQFGTLRAILTAEDTTMPSMMPDQLYTAYSTDDGLTWTGFSPLYADCHDPVVVLDSLGTYHVYFSYLNTGFRTATSADGIAWSAVPDMLYLLHGADTLIEAGTPERIADLGAAVTDSGTIMLISNYMSVLGPWRHIAYYLQSSTTSLTAVNQTSPVYAYPNPATDVISLAGMHPGQLLGIYNIQGSCVLANWDPAMQPEVSISGLPAGLYYIQTADFNRFSFIKAE